MLWIGLCSQACVPSQPPGPGAVEAGSLQRLDEVTGWAGLWHTRCPRRKRDQHTDRHGGMTLGEEQAGLK